tara:strand:+ start:39 stop:1175 length:1137 start_codon:yes stop_codon:yes gene_type:complete
MDQNFVYRPEKIIIDRNVSNEPLTIQVCRQFENVPKLVVENYAWHKDESDIDPLLNPLSLGKKTLHLKYFKGIPIKPCPGFSEKLVCCNYLSLDLIENCPFECTYCILQAFLNKPVITLHANLDEILNQVLQKTSKRPDLLYRISTGEHSDSLALDHIFNINKYVIPFFSKLPNVLLELKTKSKHVEHLLDIPHGGKTIISWSINPETIIDKEEIKTARLNERLNAAKLASDAGFKIAFHFDPLIYFYNWEKEYRDLVDQIFDIIPQDRIQWISFGTLRYINSLKDIVENRFPKSKIFLGEFVKGKDGKMRYIKKIRQVLYKNVQNRIKKLAPKIPTYLCMEKHDVWENTMGNYQPKTPLDIENHITSKFREQVSIKT